MIPIEELQHLIGRRARLRTGDGFGAAVGIIAVGITYGRPRLQVEGSDVDAKPTTAWVNADRVFVGVGPRYAVPAVEAAALLACGIEDDPLNSTP